MDKGPHKISEIATLGGQIEVTAGKRAKQFGDNFGEYINTYGEINTL